MRIILVSLLFVACFIVSAYAQPKNKPVTLPVHADLSNEKLVEAYDKLFKQLEFSNNDSLIFYLQNGLEEFERRDYVKGQASLLNMLGSAYSIKGMQPLAKTQLTASLKLFKTLGDKNDIASVHNILGIIEGKTGDYKTALQHFFT